MVDKWILFVIHLSVTGSRWRGADGAERESAGGRDPVPPPSGSLREQYGVAQNLSLSPPKISRERIQRSFSRQEKKKELLSRRQAMTHSVEPYHIHVALDNTRRVHSLSFELELIRE
jgi:hypothetical protein